MQVSTHGDKYSCGLLCSACTQSGQGDGSCNKKLLSPENIAHVILKMSLRSKAWPWGMLGCITMGHL